MKLTSPYYVSPAIVTLEHAAELAVSARRLGRWVVLTNGCFDILHRGHIEMLKEAKKLGDFLMVGVNCDESVRALKGPGRPCNSQDDRIALLHALRFVDFVFPFRGPSFMGAISDIRPDIYVKGGDYVDEGALDPDERSTLVHLGARIHILPKQEGYSTTATIGKIDDIKSTA
jgi:rfaE bifunctional protein nucleotidyltransferase chain/domain